MSRLKTAFQYLQHQIKGFNRHGVHSPFVYDFLENVLYKDAKPPKFDELVNQRKKLFNDTRKIKITDLGAGSKINTSTSRLVKDVAKNSSKQPKYGRLFHRIVRFYKIGNVIELGTSLGLSTIYFACDNPKVNVTTLEGCPETLKIAQENFDFLAFSNIKTVLGDFKTTLPRVLHKEEVPELIFFDGNHQEQATLEYFHQALKTVSSTSIYIFDDIHWSTGMTNAWNKIKGHPQTVVTLDLFFVGIVFFDQRLTPQDFNIRF